jgi:hypothetical protein
MGSDGVRVVMNRQTIMHFSMEMRIFRRHPRTGFFVLEGVISAFNPLKLSERYIHIFYLFKLHGVGWDWVHLVCWTLIGQLYQSRMINEYGAFGGMRIGRGNWSIPRKPAPMPLCPPQIPRPLCTIYWYEEYSVFCPGADHSSLAV